ncbi:SDR family NAD(P)-dependent oxidoreductase [Marisediminicola senii]|uniref:SDR family NAD(P)-dependent oxidoreductase n=1 Tax=Marisediminicola senii TaxID=2711233 RepID=UPI0013EC8936|nr:SDR family NAD(P)-dependent oxidoreductase [Marisediminicola senii]
MTERLLALVTGATAGIGREFAQQLAASGHDLILVARERGRLETTASAIRDAHRVTVSVLAADLGTPEGCGLVEDRMADSASPVSVLVNNAGFGIQGAFHENDIDDEQAMLDLLVAVPMRLTHAALQQMVPRRTGTIINIASVAGYLPAGTYSSAKAWLLSFSRWANAFYRDHGITVTAIAPGFVRTEFHERMRVSTETVPDALWLRAELLVRIALRDVARGRAVSIPTARYKLVALVARITPARIAARQGLRNR